MPIEINKQDNAAYASLGKLKARAVFKTLSPPLRAKTSEGWIERPQTSGSFPATYTRQMSDGTHQTVRYYKTKTYRDTPSGNQVEQYEPNFVTIDGGEINLSTVTDKDLYWWLVNHPHNKSNPMYDKVEKSETEQRRIDELVINRTVPFEFFEVDRRKSSKSNLEAERQLEKARKMVLAEAGDEGFIDNKQVALLCRAYGMYEVDDCILVEDYDTLRSALLEQAKVDPEEFIKKHESAALGIEAMVADAIKLNVIKYDQPTASDGGFYWDSVSKPISPKQICTIPASQYDKRETLLVDFLRMDATGVSISKRIKDEVAIARKAKALSATV